jgi:acetyltransferase-like isoleucine patch superfamily enzyme
MFIVLSILLLLYLLDNFFTFIYCTIQKRKTHLYMNEEIKPKTYTVEEVLNYKFPKKQIKWCFHVYKGWIRYKLHRLGKVPCHAYRNFILRHVYLMKMAKNAVLYGGFEIRAPWNIEIQEGAVIGDESKLDGRNGLIIGKSVNFSTGVWIWTEQHDLNDAQFNSNESGGPVVIGDRAWVSSRTTILPNKTIGEGAVVAAGAVVTKSVPPFSVVGGVPAKIIGERNRDLEYEFKGMHEAFW